jgi:hypothetical protein
MKIWGCKGSGSAPRSYHFQSVLCDRGKKLRRPEANGFRIFNKREHVLIISSKYRFSVLFGESQWFFRFNQQNTEKWNHEKHELHERKKTKLYFLNEVYFRVFGVFRG